MQVWAGQYSSSQPAIAAGGITALGAITPGAAYTNGQYNGVPITGGTGAGATANVTVAGGVVTVVTIVNPGSGYKVGDVISVAAASIGGTGGGYSQPVTATSQFTTCRAIMCLTGGTITYQQGPIGAPGPVTAVPMLAEQILPVELNCGIISSLGAGTYELLS